MPLLAPGELDEPFATVLGTTAAGFTQGAFTTALPPGTVLVTCYLQGSNAQDVVTFTDERTNTHTVLPGAYLPNNLQLVVVVSTIRVGIRVGDKVTAALPTGITRNRRLLGVRAFRNLDLSAGGIVSAAAQNLSPAATPTTPSVPLGTTAAPVPDGALVLGVLATTGAGGAVSRAGAMVQARSAATQTGQGDKRLSTAWRVADRAGPVTVAAVQAVPAPAPWAMVALALPAEDLELEFGRLYVEVDGQDLAVGGPLIDNALTTSDGQTLTTEDGNVLTTS